MRHTRQQETAHHEAGHAVAAWWFGQLKKRDYVTIVADGAAGSRGHFRNPPRFISEVERESGMNGRTTLQAEKFIMGCLAGNAASCRYKNRKRRYLVGGRSDREQAVEVLSHLVESNEELRLYFRLLQVRAENLIDRFWPEVEAVAERLLLEKRLNGEQIRETCLEARRLLKKSSPTSALPIPTLNGTPRTT